jgi:DNA-binding NarL/FixJ family response regulator
MLDRSSMSSSGRLSKNLRNVTVCIFSPHPLVLSEFTQLLASSSFQVKTRNLGSPSTTNFRQLDLPRCPLYVVDAYTPSSAAMLVAEIIDRYSDARIIAVGERFDEASAFPLLRSGAKGLLTYADAGTDLPRALEALLEGSFWVSRTMLGRFVDSILPSTRNRYLLNGPAGLSRREREVLQAVLENLSNKEIAGQLNISERTAKFHVSNLLAKFGVERRADLILMCFKGPSLSRLEQQQGSA